MRTRILSTQFASFLLFAMLAAGCQQDPGVLTPVTGRVTFNGVPLNGGLIVFVPDASKGESGESAYSKIQDDGSYNLYTGEAPGAHAGWYRVTVSSPGPITPVPGQPYNMSESILPDRYGHPEYSRINCKVTLNQANSFDFNLTPDKVEKTDRK